jgi:hypothetical protein
MSTILGTNGVALGTGGVAFAASDSYPLQAPNTQHNPILWTGQGFTQTGSLVTATSAAIPKGAGHQYFPITTTPGLQGGISWIPMTDDAYDVIGLYDIATTDVSYANQRYGYDVAAGNLGSATPPFLFLWINGGALGTSKIYTANKTHLSVQIHLEEGVYTCRWYRSGLELQDFRRVITTPAAGYYAGFEFDTHPPGLPGLRDGILSAPALFNR